MERGRYLIAKFQVKMSQRHEKEIEDLWPMIKRTPSSGNKMEKGDLQSEETHGILFKVECKSTQNSSYGISKTVWNTIKSHAQNKSWLMRPALCVRLYGPTTEMTEWGEVERTPENLRVEQDFVILDINDFLEMYEDYLRLLEKENASE